MFYLLHKKKLLAIDPDRIYTFCPRCGTLHAVDLQTVIETAGPEFDLCKTAVYCRDCSRDEFNRKKALQED